MKGILNQAGDPFSGIRIGNGAHCAASVGRDFIVTLAGLWGEFFFGDRQMDDATRAYWEERSKPMLFVFGILDSLVAAGLIEANLNRRIMPKGIARYDQLRAEGYRATETEIRSSLDVIFENQYNTNLAIICSRFAIEDDLLAGRPVDID
jgi:hypothetical protein